MVLAIGAKEKNLASESYAGYLESLTERRVSRKDWKAARLWIFEGDALRKRVQAMQRC